MKRSKTFVISFFALGVLFLICALPAADWVLAVFYEFEPNFRDFRFQDTVNAMHICSCTCFLSGMIVYVMEKLKKE